jgi:hypothetical protein
VALDDRDPLAAMLGQPAGGDLTGRAGANYYHVELPLHISLLRAWLPWARCVFG